MVLFYEITRQGRVWYGPSLRNLCTEINKSIDDRRLFLLPSGMCELAQGKYKKGVSKGARIRKIESNEYVPPVDAIFVRSLSKVLQNDIGYEKESKKIELASGATIQFSAEVVDALTAALCRVGVPGVLKALAPQ